MEKGLISVIVPVFNAENYLGRCIKSILRQTYSHIQLILVDDGSADTSGRICDYFCRKDDRVEVIHKNNEGPMAARVSGLVAARGEYTGFIDSDDYIDEGFYGHLIDYIAETGADFVQMGFDYAGESGAGSYHCPRKVFHIADNRAGYIAKGLLEMGLTGFKVSYSMCTKLFRTELIRKCLPMLPENLKQGEDLLCICNCMLNCKVIATLDYEEYHCTVRPDSLSRKRELDRFVQVGKLYEALHGLFESYEGYGTVSRSIDSFYRSRLLHDFEEYFGIDVPRYLFPDIKDLFGRKVIIYGAGQVGKDYYAQISRYEQCEIAALSDRDSRGRQYGYIHITSRDALVSLDYDLVVIAVSSEAVADEIRSELAGIGIRKESIIWRKPVSLAEHI